MIDTTKMMMLLNKGANVATLINNSIEENDELRPLPTNLIVIGAVLYAAGWARKTGLNIEAFISLAASAYQQVEIEKKEDEKPTA